MSFENDPIDGDNEHDNEQLATCLQLLDQLCQDPESCLGPNSPYRDIVDKAGLLSRRLKAARRKESRNRDQRVIAEADIRKKRQSKQYGRYLQHDSSKRPVATVLSGQRKCYVCKQGYQSVHHFYDAMCHSCADENFLRREQSADLRGRTILVTGGRIKIGFQIALKCLRGGATVLATSRFPHDAALRFSQETDFADWSDRLRIYAADFRSLPAVNAMCDGILQEHSSINAIINNAAQTVRRPPEYYRDLVQRESALAESLGPNVVAAISSSDSNNAMGLTAPVQNQLENTTLPSSLSLSAAMTQIPMLSDDGKHAKEHFPIGLADLDGQQIDARPKNSWVMPLRDVNMTELIEVHAVTALVPFLLIQRLESRLLASEHFDRYIVNVSAMEGQFNTRFKAVRHPHTNMAKASMNMLTRTSAEDYAQNGIYMNSVDTGWVTNEFPLPQTEAMQADGFEPPLDEIDGAARVCDPIFRGVENQEYVYGKFLKDYRETKW